MENAIEPILFNHNDISDLDSVNILILNYNERLMDSTANHFNSDYLPKKNDPNRNRNWFFTNPSLLEKYIPEERNKLGYLYRHSFEHKDKLRNFRIYKIDFFPADSLFSYELKTKTVGDTIIVHELWHNIKPNIFDRIKPDIKRKERVNASWIYIIRYYIDSEWNF